jgi:capsular polysaccharide biosynthesis protein
VTTLDPTLPRAQRHPDDNLPPGPEPPEPPSGTEPALGPLRPVADRWPLVLLVVLLFVGGGVYAGMSRSPTYRAETEINVGRTDVRVQALPGYVAGAATLANAYSRVVVSDEIVDRVAPELGVPKGDVTANLTAAPVPENPILRIIGKGATPDEAVRLTSVAAAQLKRYVARTDAASKSADNMLAEFRRQSRRAADLRRQLRRLETRDAQAAALGATVEAPSAAEEDELRVAYETAKLRADSLSQMFRDRQVELASTAGIQVISRPALAGDDRRSVLQRLIAVGLVAGVVVGSALAMLLGSRRRRRRS